MKPRVSFERLREVLSYDSETGLFTWLISLSPVVKPGDIAGTVTIGGYIHIGIDRVYFGAHRLAWLYIHGQWPKEEIDHVNLDRTDNRLCNLREANNQQNSANTRAQKNNRVGIKGVQKKIGNRGAVSFRARIRVNDNLLHLGYFETAKQASDAYASAATLHFGAFVRTK